MQFHVHMGWNIDDLSPISAFGYETTRTQLLGERKRFLIIIQCHLSNLNISQVWFESHLSKITRPGATIKSMSFAFLFFMIIYHFSHETTKICYKSHIPSIRSIDVFSVSQSEDDLRHHKAHVVVLQYGKYHVNGIIIFVYWFSSVLLLL